MFKNHGLIGFSAGKVVIVAKRLETTNGIAPEADLFTFSKMAAGMYLEHYLDSKMVILSAKQLLHTSIKLLSHMICYFQLAGCMLTSLSWPCVSQYSVGSGAGYLLGCRVP